MAKLDPNSPDAIRLYLFAAALVSAFLLTYFLVVPSMKNACVWFTSGCTSITVVRGDDNRLWVTMTGSPYAYFYDGHNTIYAYGQHLSGSCPKGVVTGATTAPVESEPVPTAFCYKWVKNPEDETQPLVCVNYNAQCTVFPATITNADGTKVYSCDGGKTTTPEPQCCKEETLPPESALQCSKAMRMVKTASGETKFTCDPVSSTTPVLVDTNTCCVPTPPCPKTADGLFQQCSKVPSFNWDENKYSCEGGSAFTDSPDCCECTAEFKSYTYGGTSSAEGDIFEPVFAVDAQTMKVVTSNRGVVCGLKRDIASSQFEPYRAEHTVDLSVRVDANSTAGLNVYQIFDVLKKKHIFNPPSST